MPPSTATKPKPPRLNLHGQMRPRSRTRSIGNNTLVVDGQRAHSRTPTLMRTPHRRPATPTHASAAHSSSLVALPMTHSVSQGSHAPRSARRWARTAHLHELRGGASGSGSGPTQRASVPHETSVPHSAGPAASVLSLNSDVFASPTPVPSGALSAGLMGLRASVGGNGGGTSRGGGMLFHGLFPDSEPPDLVRGNSEDAGDGDQWVDTDDGSEIDGDGDAEIVLESPLVERVEQVAVGA